MAWLTPSLITFWNLLRQPPPSPSLSPQQLGPAASMASILDNIMSDPGETQSPAPAFPRDLVSQSVTVVAGVEVKLQAGGTLPAALLLAAVILPSQ